MAELAEKVFELSQSLEEKWGCVKYRWKAPTASNRSFELYARRRKACPHNEKAL